VQFLRHQRPREADIVELRIRILPDDINIDSFEESLTPAELERGQQFWKRVWKGDKPETACTTSPAATTGKGEEKTANSMSVEKSAVLPEAGGANSAAPTVQSGGKPLKVSPDCPPDSKPK